MLPHPKQQCTLRAETRGSYSENYRWKLDDEVSFCFRRLISNVINILNIMDYVLFLTCLVLPTFMPSFPTSLILSFLLSHHLVFFFLFFLMIFPSLFPSFIHPFLSVHVLFLPYFTCWKKF